MDNHSPGLGDTINGLPTRRLQAITPQHLLPEQDVPIPSGIRYVRFRPGSVDLRECSLIPTGPCNVLSVSDVV